MYGESTSTEVDEVSVDRDYWIGCRRNREELRRMSARKS